MFVDAPRSGGRNCRDMVTRLGLVSALVFLGLATAHCGGGGGVDGKGPAESGGTCKDHRKPLDCDTEVSYQGVKTEGGVHVLNIAGANAAFTNTSLRQVNEKVEQYVIAQTRLCREYNSCVVDADTYHNEARAAREHLSGIDTLVTQVNGSDPVRKGEAADQLFSRVAGQSTNAFSAEVVVEARLPASAGGGTIIVAPNYPVPTNARVAFQFSVTQAAHVYLFQIGTDKSVSVLFPDPRMTTKNPLSSATAARVPEGGQAFRLDESGLGSENVYIVASTRPLAALEASLRRFASGERKTLAEDPLLAEFAALGNSKTDCPVGRNLTLVADEKSRAPAEPTQGTCFTPRGLVLDTPPASNQAVQHSLKVRAAAGDDLIVRKFAFDHVTEAAFPARRDAYNAPTPQGAHTRGISIEN